MNKNHVTGLLLTLTFGAATIAGCSSDSAPAAQDPGNKGASSGKPVELTFFMNTNINAKAVKGFEEVEAYKEIQKRTNTSIKFQQPGDGSQFNIMLASGTYPDIVYAPSNYPGGIAKLVEDGVAIKLNDLIDKHAPNYKKILTEHPEIRKQIMLDDGTIAKFPQIDIDLHRIAYSGQMVRADWLDKVGLKPPGTIDEWYTVLKAFKEKDPNGNGVKDEIPLGERGDSLGSISAFATSWGILPDKFQLNPKTGKVTFGPIEPAYKDYVSTMNKWYKEGLIDSEFAATDKKAFEAKFAKNSIGSYGGVISGVNAYKDLLKSQVPDFKLLGLSPPIGAAGKSYSGHTQMVQNVPLDGAFISSQAKDPVAAVKLLDYMIGPDGSDLQNWGIEGKSYKVENGKKKFTDEVFKSSDGFEPSEAVKKYALPTTGMVKVMDFDAWAAFELKYPEAVEANDLWFKADRSLLIPPISFNGQESQKLGSIMSEVNTYVKEMWIKFIMGNEPVDNYDKFVATLKKMGIDEAIQIYQTAYERYQNRK
ncbi:putative aldouronate transport system substrate-binding protein [Paenibacillus sp. 1_12]|uniref:extracellular solute-binding protein n=1 Tax=Paenibacillus sp. 1_12 TaxID=1566278 RepID=UPI0008F3B1AD|nr:extracellular solute-binding protein [Paenibacillus sp. 1_12]SFM54527.1 putative aldouronate transport system substrate-binding protein [Paenibacillus sp. 1_12]